jgi:hypothetical protein
MPPVGFELTILVGERPQTYVLDRAATETDTGGYFVRNKAAGASSLPLASI